MYTILLSRIKVTNHIANAEYEVTTERKIKAFLNRTIIDLGLKAENETAADETNFTNNERKIPIEGKHITKLKAEAIISDIINLETFILFPINLPVMQIKEPLTKRLTNKYIST